MGVWGCVALEKCLFLYYCVIKSLVEVCLELTKNPECVKLETETRPSRSAFESERKTNTESLSGCFGFTKLGFGDNF